MGLVVDVVFLAEYTLILVQTTITAIRRFEELIAHLFHEVGTDFVA